MSREEKTQWNGRVYNTDKLKEDYDKLKQIGEKVQAVYGENITYDRINVISNLTMLSSKDENTLARVFDEKILTKLMGY